MRLVRSLLMILGLFALAAGGAVAATPEPVEPPCHAQTSGHPSDGDRPTAPMKVMNCCVAWVVAPPTPDAPPAVAAPSPVRPSPSLARPLTSVSLAPEITPPRA